MEFITSERGAHHGSTSSSYFPELGRSFEGPIDLKVPLLSPTGPFGSRTVIAMLDHAAQRPEPPLPPKKNARDLNLNSVLCINSPFVTFFSAGCNQRCRRYPYFCTIDPTCHSLSTWYRLWGYYKTHFSVSGIWCIAPILTGNIVPAWTLT